MYQSKMALAVKANKRVLREFEDAVYIPFGMEYSLMIKNLNSVKALVRVWIDGTDVTDGTSLVVGANQSIDLERFIKNGNMDEGNKFKFIERTAGISAHRGNKIDDGLIRVEFEFAVPQPATRYLKSTQWPNYQPYPNDDVYRGLVGNAGFGDTTTFSSTDTYASGQLGAAPVASGGTMRSRGTSTGFVNQVSTQSAEAYSLPVQGEVGITVAGGVSDQKFTAVAWFPTDGVKHVMVLRVLGEVGGEPVMAPVTVKTKPICASCGVTNRATAKFCAECGTGLQIV